MKKFLYPLILLFSFKFVFALTITEIMYNPEGNDSGREWIEVLNNFSQKIEIASGKNGWRINDGKNHLFEENLTVNSQEVFVIVQDKHLFLKDYPNFRGKLVTANFSLKNESGQIQIFDSQKNLLTQVSYQSSCGGNGNGFSIIFENNTCKENKIKGGTPGSLEVYEEKINDNKEPPLAVLNTLSTSTNLNNQPQQLTETKGNNNQLTTLNSDINLPLEDDLKIDQGGGKSNVSLIISEFYPNPPGNDNGQEFVEIYNPNDEIIDLNGFILEIGKKKIKLSGRIEPEEYFVITNKDYNFSIRNKGEELNLYFNQDKIFSISYQGQASEGKSFSRFEDGWQFTEPTPGKENIKSKKEKQISEIKSENSQLNQNLTHLESQIANIKPKQIDSNSNQIIYLIFCLFLIISLTLIVWLRL